MDKKVAVIGSGSTAIQIVPTLQPKVKHMGAYVRGRTWIGFPFLSDLVKDRNPSGANCELMIVDIIFLPPQGFRNEPTRFSFFLSASSIHRY